MAIRRRAFLVLLAVGLLGVAMLPPAGAILGTLYVNNGVACDDTTADSSLTPYCTIQAAVDDASSGATVDVAAGTYISTSPVGAVYINSKDLTLRGAGESATLIDGETQRIALRIDNSSVAVSDLGVTRGLSSGSGGGIYILGSAAETVTVTDVTVTNSVGTYSAGAMLVSGATVALLRVTLDGGDGLNGGGGGISVGGDATVTIDDSTIENCEASNPGVGQGGGLLMSGSGTNVTITDSTIENNESEYRGAGIYMHSGTLTLDGVTVHMNGAGGVVDGGGIFQGGGTLIIEDSLFTSNQATGYGGGLGVYSADETTIRSSTFSDNQAGTFGGGIAYLIGTLSGSTITGNSANDGGGLGGSVETEVQNSIVASNTATVDHPDCTLIVHQGHNLIGDTTGCVSQGDTTGNVLNQDPLLAGLADNGGPTYTHALGVGSPAKDAGNPATPDGSGFACEVTDQRGWDRDGDDGRCDIGAFEVLTCDGKEITIPGTTGHDTINGTPGDDVIHGFGGWDKIDGNAGDDTICGGPGSDTLGGGDGKDRVFGGSKHDTIYGGDGKDALFGEDGNDTIYGEGHHDILKGGRQNDILWGGLGDDRIKGGSAVDELYGQKGDDQIWGQRGDDLLNGGSGTDTGDGGPHVNTCVSIEVPTLCTL